MYKKILVVVDDREVSQSAIRQAIEIAQVHRADIHFFYVMPHYEFTSFDMLPVADLPPEEFQNKAKAQAHSMLKQASDLAEYAGIQSFQAMGSGKDDAQCVSDAAERKHCDLIVVGTEGSNAVMRILNGSIIPGLISVATVPILICRDMGSHNEIKRKANAAQYARLRRRENLERRQQEDND